MVVAETSWPDDDCQNYALLITDKVINKAIHSSAESV